MGISWKRSGRRLSIAEPPTDRVPPTADATDADKRSNVQTKATAIIVVTFAFPMAMLISRTIGSSTLRQACRRSPSTAAIASSSSSSSLSSSSSSVHDVGHQSPSLQQRKITPLSALHYRPQPQTKRRSFSTKSDFDSVVRSSFPGAVTNTDLVEGVTRVLSTKGFNENNTLLATSLCADELARVIEDDFVKIYGNNFNLGGLSGFPFAGNTGFGAMAAHIPDDGFCLLIHGPHVGICQNGEIGKVERRGCAMVDNCCGSAIAANNYLKGITHGGAEIQVKLQQFSDFQQGAVQELILPFGKRLADAEECEGAGGRMRELPYALYDSQEMLVKEIIRKGKGGIKGGLALLGGIQINTSPDTDDYFHPLRFDYYNGSGECLGSMLNDIA